MKMRAAANRLTPLVLPKSSFIVLDDLALPSCRGRRTRPARKMVPSRPAIAQSAGLKPMTSRSRPPTKKPTPFIAFFDPVNQATHRKSWPLPSDEVALIADLEAVLVRSLATPATPCAATTHATENAALHCGSRNDSMISPAICRICPAASMRGIPYLDAK